MCQRAAPRTIVDAAQRAADAHAATATRPGGVTHRAGAPATGRTPSGGAARPAAGEQGRRSYAEVARAANAPKGEPATLADLLAALGLAGDDSNPSPSVQADAMEDVPADKAREARYWRERLQAATRAGPFGQDDAALCESKLHALQAEARSARPWAARVQAATARQTKAAGALAAAERDVRAAQQALAALQQKMETARTEAQEAAAELAKVQAEAVQPTMEVQDPLHLDQALAAVRTAAALAGVDLNEVAHRLANAATAQPSPATPQPMGQGQVSQTYIPAAQPDPPSLGAVGRQRTRSPRRDGDDGASDAGSTVLRRRQ